MLNTPVCCGKKTKKVILSPPAVGAMSFGREKSFYMTDGTFIDSGAQYKRYMKDNNKIPADEGAQEAERVRKCRKEDFDKKIDDTVRESYQELTA